MTDKEILEGIFEIISELVLFKGSDGVFHINSYGSPDQLFASFNGDDFNGSIVGCNRSMNVYENDCTNFRCTVKPLIEGTINVLNKTALMSLFQSMKVPYVDENEANIFRINNGYSDETDMDSMMILPVNKDNLSIVNHSKVMKWRHLPFRQQIYHAVIYCRD